MSAVHAEAASTLIAAPRHAPHRRVGSRGFGAVKEALLGSTPLLLVLRWSRW